MKSKSKTIVYLIIILILLIVIAVKLFPFRHIEDFYPHRKSFHVSEFAVFYAGVIYYLAASYRFDEAQVKIELLEEAGIKESIIDNLHRVKMRYMFE